VHGESSAGAGYAAARLQVRDSLTNGDDRSCAAIARRLRLVEPGANRLPSRGNPIAPHFSEDFSHQIGAGFRLLQQTFCGKLGGGALRARRNDRCSNTHKHAVGQQLGRRYLFNRDLTGASVLKNLLHGVRSLSLS
jgi:hypothetical protein